MPTYYANELTAELASSGRCRAVVEPNTMWAEPAVGGTARLQDISSHLRLLMWRSQIRLSGSAAGRAHEG